MFIFTDAASPRSFHHNLFLSSIMMFFVMTSATFTSTVAPFIHRNQETACQ
jgi:hypothetical protein